MKQPRFRTAFFVALLAAGLLLPGGARCEEASPSLIGQWVSEYDDKEAGTKSHFLIVRTLKGRLLIKTLHLHHKAKKYAYDTELGAWSLEGKRYTEVIDGDRAEGDNEYDLEGEVLELADGVFRYRMTWEGAEEEEEDLVVEKRVIGSEYPLPPPPKGYSKVSIDDFYNL